MQRCEDIREWRCEIFGQRISFSSLSSGTTLDGLRLTVSGFVVQKRVIKVTLTMAMRIKSERGTMEHNLIRKLKEK